MTNGDDDRQSNALALYEICCAISLTIQSTMSWDEKKRGKEYFYLGVRDGERVKKLYLGNGVPSQMAANRIALHRAERKVQADAWRAAVASWDGIDLFRNQLLAGVQLLTSGSLLAAGFHQASRHRWRRRQHE